MDLKLFLFSILLLMFAQIASADIDYDKSVWEVSATENTQVSRSYMYSNLLVATFPTNQIDGFRVVSSCPVDWIEDFKVTHWDGKKHQPVSTQQLLSKPRETVYKVNANGQSIDSFLIRLRWDHALTSSCHFAFEVTKKLIASSATTGAVDFCGNGIDEDGDGQDLPCSTSTGPIPVIRTITITNRGANEGITVDPQGPIQFPSGADARVRIINKSVWKVDFSGNLSPGWLQGPYDEITMSVGAPGKVKLAIPFENIFIKLERAAPAKKDAPTPFKGTFTLTNGAVLEARLNVTAESGPACIDQNSVNSVRECVGLAGCRIKTSTHVTLLDPKTSQVVTEYNFLTDQCNTYGDRHESHLSWNTSGKDLSINAYYADSLHTDIRKLNLTGSPAGLKGQLENVGGMSGSLKVQYSP